jgi:catechol 2,3-dioxygenase-like lactoylglutathione lyase family enzyme
MTLITTVAFSSEMRHFRVLIRIVRKYTLRGVVLNLVKIACRLGCHNNLKNLVNSVVEYRSFVLQLNERHLFLASLNFRKCEIVLNYAVGDKTMTKNTLRRMDNVGIVVESLDEAIAFFAELGLSLEGRATVEGEWAGRVTGLGSQRVEIAMMVTPDGHSRLEISRFLTPPVVADHRNAPVNALGYLRVMFTVDDIDETLARLSKRGAQLVGEVVQYEDSYRLCYIRGPEGLLIGLAEQLGNK